MRYGRFADKPQPLLQPVPEEHQQKRDVHVGDRLQRDVLHRKSTGPDADKLCQVSRYVRFPGRSRCTACVVYRCHVTNSSEITEGEFLRFNGSHVPSSADIVFIIEAKRCNENFTEKRNVHTLLTMMLKELSDIGMTNNK